MLISALIALSGFEKILLAISLALLSLGLLRVAIIDTRKRAVGAPAVYLGGYETALFAFMVMALLFVGVSVSKIFSGERFSESGIYISTVILQVAFSIFSILFARKIGVNMGIGKLTYAIKCGLAYFVLCAVSVLSLGVCVSIFHLAIFGENMENQMAVEMFMNIDAVWVKILAAFSIIILAPISEELFFRALLYPATKGWIASFLEANVNRNSETFENKFKREFSVVGAAIIVSALFSLIHSSAYAAVPLFLMGVLLACCYEKTNSILSPIIAHTLFNVANVLMILFS